jgi:hypothetical protein
VLLAGAILVSWAPSTFFTLCLPCAERLEDVASMTETGGMEAMLTVEFLYPALSSCWRYMARLESRFLDKGFVRCTHLGSSPFRVFLRLEYTLESKGKRVIESY